MPRDMVPEIGLTPVRAVLKGTDIEIVFALTPKEYAHYQYLTGQRVEGSQPLDQVAVKKMSALLLHLK